MKFRKKPVLIEAEQFLEGGFAVPGMALWVDHPELERPRDGSGGFIDTLEGRMRVMPGDWVIRGVAGEYYPCKPEIFAATYEAAE